MLDQRVSCRRISVRRWPDIGHQHFSAFQQTLYGQCFGNLCVGFQRRFDFRGLDADASNLYLPVSAAQHIQIATVTEHGNITCAIDSTAIIEQRGRESLRRLPRIAEVAKGKNLAAHQQFAGRPDRCVTAPFMLHHHLRTGYR
ncbi:Tryptophanyl-tRNA synthetase [Pseudomonas syringae pv. actinidiae]|uniref:Tryptophanyl-tRNA synthetase n=1 Tax=Pseudomonas syringae pv. actinidiae TaxID=103796 RepID=A0AAN4Q0P2_PSESF|nr:Tryptophanyl-tRNA synthetase [Pseudomonas syringae pv. actinidiae]